MFYDRFMTIEEQVMTLEQIKVHMLIPTGNEPSSYACMDIWRMPLGVLRTGDACSAATGVKRRLNVHVL